MASDGRRANHSPQRGRALCTRCGGLLVTEHYLDLHYDTGQIDFTALRCASCGEVIDPVRRSGIAMPMAATRRSSRSLRMQRDGEGGKP